MNSIYKYALVTESLSIMFDEGCHLPFVIEIGMMGYNEMCKNTVDRVYFDNCLLQKLT